MSLVVMPACWESFFMSREKGYQMKRMTSDDIHFIIAAVMIAKEQNERLDPKS
jgi:hypothetical protein